MSRYIDYVYSVGFILVPPYVFIYQLVTRITVYYTQLNVPWKSRTERVQNDVTTVYGIITWFGGVLYGHFLCTFILDNDAFYLFLQWHVLFRVLLLIHSMNGFRCLKYYQLDDTRSGKIMISLSTFLSTQYLQENVCWVISLGCCPRIDRPAHTLYIYGRYILVYCHCLIHQGCNSFMVSLWHPGG